MNKKEAMKLLDEERVCLEHCGPPYAHRHPFSKGMKHINEREKEYREARWYLEELKEEHTQ